MSLYKLKQPQEFHLQFGFEVLLDLHSSNSTMIAALGIPILFQVVFTAVKIVP
jgi:hypothetical protein